MMYRTPINVNDRLLFMQGVKRVAKQQAAPSQDLPDIRKLWHQMEKLHQEGPRLDKLCEACISSYSTMALNLAIPLRQDDIAKIVFPTLRIEQNTIRFNIRDRKNRPTKGLSECIVIEDANLVKLLEEFLRRREKLRVCKHEDDSDPFKHKFLCDNKLCAQGYYLFIKPNGRQYTSQRISKKTQALMTIAGISNRFSPKHLRHMTATALYVATNDMDFVRRAGGWMTEVTLDRHYLRTAFGISTESLRAALGKTARKLPEATIGVRTNLMPSIDRNDSNKQN